MSVQAIRDALAARPDPGRTHWNGCETDRTHRDCAIAALLVDRDALLTALETLDQLLGRYLDNHCQAADQEGMSALCECRLCLDTRAARDRLHALLAEHAG